MTIEEARQRVLRWQISDEITTDLAAFEKEIESAYIPLVEAARAFIRAEDAVVREGYRGGIAEWDAAYERVRAALVQVPGQQQAEQDGVGGVG